MLILFQILLVCIALAAIAGIHAKKKEGMLSKRAAFFWLSFWLAVIVAVVWPESTSTLAEAVGIGRGTDLVIYLSIAVLFFLLFKLQVTLEKMRRDITKITREDALKSTKKKL